LEARLKGLRNGARSLTPLTRNLLIFALVNDVLLNILLRLTQGWHQFNGPRESVARQQFTLYHTALFFLFRTTKADSWAPMTAAWEFLTSGGSGSVYDHVWQQNQLKFQYPLSSLLPLEVVHAVFPGDTIRWAPLNLVSWLAVWGTALLVALIFRDSCREHLRLSILSGASRGDEIVRMVIAVALTLTFYPVVRGFTLGQTQPWIDFLFAAMVWLTMKRQPVAAGVTAGLMCLVKPQLALLLVWAALRRQWRFAAALAAIAGVGTLAAVAAYGLQANLDYVPFLSYISRHGEAYYGNQTVNGLVNRLLYNGDAAGIYEPSFAPFRWPVYLSTLASSALIIGFAMLWRRREYDGAPAFDLMIFGLSITMASPIAWYHHYGILMPLFAALLPAVVRWPVFGGWSLAYIAVAYVLSSNLFYITRSFTDTPFTIVQSYLFFAALMVLVALYLVRRAAAGDHLGEGSSRGGAEATATSA
jgi:alpha-1,2-mannosyltransferase